MPTTSVSSNSSSSSNQQRVAASVDVYPRQFGERYTLLKELGQGGMGQIFMAMTGQEGAERVCALKVIRQLESPGRQPHELGKRFLDEAKVVTKLSHENLVYVFDFGVVGEQGYLAMEYLRGKTLAELWNRCAIRKVGFPLGVSLHMVTEIAAGLAYAHGLGRFDLVHRDISPSNVMLSYTGGVKLIDFGLAKWRSKLAQTMSGINWGKVSYMSPEQHTGRPIDHRSDIFSLGLILWELLTGRQLYPNEDARASNAPIPPPSQFNVAVEEGLDRIVLKALAIDPDDRFQSAAGFGQSLSRHIPKEAGKLGIAHFLAQLFEADAEAEAEAEENLVNKAVEAIKARPSGTFLSSLPQNATPADPMIGLVLADRYFVRRLIGEGAMGRVYEGHHTGIGKRVAIKVPRHAERRKAELLERFKMEANAASQIGHANIADVTDCGTTPGGDFFFVMEYVDGVDLGKLIRRDGGLPVERTVLIGIQICRALEAAHRAGIIHRDLKPGNVMLVREREGADVVKVLDFGVAKFLRSTGTSSPELTMTDAAVGTPRYMAPEQVDAGKSVDFRVDIYALGGLLYSMLTGGQSPIAGDSVQEVWHKKVNGEAVPISQWRNDLPAELEKLIMRTLERRPDARPQSMGELKQALIRTLENIRTNGSSVMGMRVPAHAALVGSETEKLERPLQRQARYVILAAIAAALTVLIWLWVERSPQVAQQVVPAEKPPQATQPGLPSNEQPMPHLPAVPPQQKPVPPPGPPTAKLEVIVKREPDRARPLSTTAAPVLPMPEASKSKLSKSAVVTAEPVAGASAGSQAPAATAASETIEASLGAAELAFRRGDLTQAATFAQKAVQQGAGVRGLLMLGKAHLFLEEYKAAADAYRRALQLEPNNAPARAGLARTEESSNLQ